MLISRWYVPMILILCVLACKKAAKDNSSNFPASNWAATDYWQGIGSADDGWHHLSSDSLVLSFDTHGKGLAYVNHVQQKGYYYQVTGDSTMEVKGDSVTMTGHDYFFIHSDTLEIWGIGCIEGCATRYGRIRAID